MFIVCLGLYSVPAYLNEWYWYRLQSGDPRYVLFHNRVYGCSGVQPEKFPCTGLPFTYAWITNTCVIKRCLCSLVFKTLLQCLKLSCLILTTGPLSSRMLEQSVSISSTQFITVLFLPPFFSLCCVLLRYCFYY